MVNESLLQHTGRDGFMRNALATTLLALTVACSQQAAVVEESRPLEVGSAVSVYTFNGDIDVSWYQGTQMELSYRKTTWRGESELDKVEVTVSQEDGQTVVRAEKLEPGAQVGVDIELRLPEGVSLAMLESSNGDVNVTGGGGDVTVNTSNGDIVFHGFEGSVLGDTSNGDVVILGGTVRGADTSNGEIEAEIREMEGGRTVLDTSNGNITVYLDPALDVRVVMDTSNGSVSVDNLALASVRIDGSDGTATLNAGTDELILDTSNGNIQVYGLDAQ